MRGVPGGGVESFTQLGLCAVPGLPQGVAVPAECPASIPETRRCEHRIPALRAAGKGAPCSLKTLCCQPEVKTSHRRCLYTGCSLCPSLFSFQQHRSHSGQCVFSDQFSRLPTNRDCSVLLVWNWKTPPVTAKQKQEQTTEAPLPGPATICDAVV